MRISVWSSDVCSSDLRCPVIVIVNTGGEEQAVQQTLRSDSGNGRARGAESPSRPTPGQSIILIALYALAAIPSLRRNRPPAALGPYAPAQALSAAPSPPVLERTQAL